MKNKDTYFLPTISDSYFEDVNFWLDIDTDEPKKKRKKKKAAKKKAAKKKQKKALKKRKKAARRKKKKAKRKYKKIAQMQYEKEFKYRLITKAADTACDITKMYFYSKFGSST